MGASWGRADAAEPRFSAGVKGRGTLRKELLIGHPRAGFESQLHYLMAVTEDKSCSISESVSLSVKRHHGTCSACFLYIVAFYFLG